MKQKDIVLIVIIVVIAAIVSLYVSKSIFVTPKNRHQQVEVVQPITTTFQTPNSAYFNSSAIDPTELITINPNANPNPF